MRRARRLAILGILAAAVGPAWADCGDEHLWRADGASYRVAFTPNLRPLPVGRLFELDLQLCPATGAAPVRALLVDAEMPAHRHGMNYRPSLRSMGPNRWRASGLMFHMPGRWRFLFDVESSTGTQRLMHEVDVE